MELNGVIFDFGFTLFYFKDASLDRYLKCFQKGLQKSIEYLEQSEVLKKEGLIREFTEIFNNKRKEYFKKSRETKNEFPTTLIFQETLDELEIFDLNEDFYVELANIYHLCEQDEWIPYEDTRKTLIEIKKRDIKLGLLSNHPHQSAVISILQKYELKDFFDVILTSGKFGERKPKEEIFIHIMEKMRLKKPNRVLMCGDEYADVVGANNVGMIPILFKREFEFPFEKEISIENLKTIERVSEILKFIN
jgi:HAD superfamily hydrolase (TIGR01549 family)